MNAIRTAAKMLNYGLVVGDAWVVEKAIEMIRERASSESLSWKEVTEILRQLKWAVAETAHATGEELQAVADRISHLIVTGEMPLKDHVRWPRRENSSAV